MKHHNSSISIKQVAAWIAAMTARGGGIPSIEGIVRALNVTPEKAQRGRAAYFAKKNKAAGG